MGFGICCLEREFLWGGGYARIFSTFVIDKSVYLHFELLFYLRFELIFYP